MGEDANDIAVGIGIYPGGFYKKKSMFFCLALQCNGDVTKCNTEIEQELEKKKERQ